MCTYALYQFICINTHFWACCSLFQAYCQSGICFMKIKLMAAHQIKRGCFVWSQQLTVFDMENPSAKESHKKRQTRQQTTWLKRIQKTGKERTEETSVWTDTKTNGQIEVTHSEELAESCWRLTCWKGRDRRDEERRVERREQGQGMCRSRITDLVTEMLHRSETFTLTQRLKRWKGEKHANCVWAWESEKMFACLLICVSERDRKGCGDAAGGDKLQPTSDALEEVRTNQPPPHLCFAPTPLISWINWESLIFIYCTELPQACSRPTSPPHHCFLLCLVVEWHGCCPIEPTRFNALCKEGASWNFSATQKLEDQWECEE